MRKKVLLVDDSPTVLMVEKMILAKGPFQIVTARDGREAIEKAKSEQPDVVLLDVVMPNLDGLSACAAIRQQPETAHIPIIMVTTRGEETIQGRWKLIAAEDLRADGSVARYPWGSRPVGSIVVEGGSCYLQIMSGDVPSFGSGAQPAGEQMKAALNSERRSLPVI